MMRFHHTSYGQSVAFGAGASATYAAEALAALQASRPLLIHSPSAAAAAEAISAGMPIIETIAQTPQHVPVPAAEAAREAAQRSSADVLISIGGGSATGLAKAVALESGLPIVAVPTTYSGSEATWMWGMSADGVKRTGTSMAVLPRWVVYDSDLLASLPADFAGASALNAVAHCVDALWAPHADPITSAGAGSGLSHLAAGIRGLAAGDEAAGRAGSEAGSRAGRARDSCLLGTYLSARAFAAAGSGLHHKICHVLGGAYALPHAQTHATVLPYVVATTLPHAPAARAVLATALGVPEDGVVGALDELRDLAGARSTLAELGLPAEGIDSIVDTVAEAVPAGHPGPHDRSTLQALITAAWQGADPASLT